MSWLAWLIVALVLCPLWWRVAQEADKLRRDGNNSIGGLPRAIYSAAFATAILIALLALASIARQLGVHGGAADEIGLF